MSQVSKAVSVGGWEGLAVAVVIVARNDAHKGDTKARYWLHHEAPYLLGLVFPDVDPDTLIAHLNAPRLVAPRKAGKVAGKRAA